MILLGGERRFGKSVGMRAVGKFVESLRRKAASAGDVEICEFPTRSTRLSQTCICGNIQKNHSPNDGILAIARLRSTQTSCNHDGRVWTGACRLR